MNGLFKLITNSDDEISEKALEAMIEIGRLNYKLMKSYLPGLFGLTNTLVDQAIAAEDP